MMLKLVAVLVCLGATLGFQHVRPSFVRRTSTPNKLRMADIEGRINPREKRREILKSPKFNRTGFKDVREDVKGQMEGYNSPLVAELRENNGVIVRDNVTVKLAEHFGFCWGVERAIAIAYEARQHFPEKVIHITNEIIHNPEVNENLDKMDIKFLPGGLGQKDYSGVDDGDVVVLPAFGATIQEMDMLTKKGVQVVDTTCPWVSKVWNAVDAHTKKDQTSIIHGKYAHEETIATASFCMDYLIVKDEAEAVYVADYIVNGGDREEFLEKFKNAISEGFDPDVHLKKVGLANQTTMYKRETKAIGRIFEVAMLKKFGPANLATHYSEFDTICDATQERQDAVTDMVDAKVKNNEDLDFVLVVGGFDSSNTAHLNEIPQMNEVTSYHIDRADRITAENTIEHRLVDGNIVVEENFLPKGKITIGVTSGASTPDKSMEDALERIFMLSKLMNA